MKRMLLVMALVMNVVSIVASDSDNYQFKGLAALQEFKKTQGKCSGCDFTGVDSQEFRQAVIGVSTGSNLTWWEHWFGEARYIDISYSNISGADFSGLTIPRLNCEGAFLRNVNFNGAKLVHGIFKKSSISNSDFSSANMFKSNFSGARIVNTNLSYTILSQIVARNTYFGYSNFFKAKIDKATLPKVDFCGSNISWANLSESDCRGANFADTAVFGTNFYGTALAGSNLKKAIDVGAALNLHKATGYTPSTKSV